MNSTSTPSGGSVACSDGQVQGLLSAAFIPNAATPPPTTESHPRRYALPDHTQAVGPRPSSSTSRPCSWRQLDVGSAPHPRVLDSKTYVKMGAVRGTPSSPRPGVLGPPERGNFLLFIFHILDFESQAGVDIYLGWASPSPCASLM